MNRRRIGLAALVVGAGAIIRRRLQTRVDAGDISNEPAAHKTSELEQPIAADSLATPATDVGREPKVAPANETSSSDTESEPASTADHGSDPVSAMAMTEAADDDADSPQPVVTESAVIEPAAGVEPVVAESAVIEPAAGVEPVVTTTPDVPEPAPATLPRIVLPSMPLAGTNIVVQPLEPTEAPNPTSETSETDRADPGNHDN